MKTWDEFWKDLLRPIRHLVDHQAIVAASVLILGLGAVGSFMAEILARTGIGIMTLWDLDVVDFSNITRSVYTVNEEGQRKSEASLEIVKAINPTAEVHIFDGDILEAPDDLLRGVALKHSVTVIAADSFQVHEKLNALLYPISTCLYTYVTDQGSTGEIVRTTPGERGCVRCLTNFNERRAAGVARDFQALGTDMQRVALEAACMVLGIVLRGKKGGDLFQEYLEPSSKLALVINRRSMLRDELPRGFVSGTIRVDTRSSSRSCPVCSKRLKIN